jgi:hypothetical protein
LALEIEFCGVEYLVFPWNLADFEGGGEGGSEGEEGYCGLKYT